MNSIIIHTEHLCYTYEDGTKALDDITVQIQRGQRIALMGSNGSGKSTFSLCLNGILKPQSGKIYFNSSPVCYSRKGLLELRKKTGIVFQDPDSQIFSASIRQEIAFGLLNLGNGQEEVKRAVDSIIRQLDMENFCEKPTHFLSGGQKKQVSLADILVMNPELIVFDEPTASLDPKHTDLVNQTIRSLSEKGMTVIVITHDVDYVLDWADQVLLFHNGKLLCQETPEQLFTDTALLSYTNLKQPAAIRLYHKLCEKNILSSQLPVPKNLKILEQYIQQS